jgi:imidazole glycerol-phosphate synthase subunit HisH
MQRVVILDYGMSNLRSVAKAVEHAGGGQVTVQVSADAADIARADRLVFPGQGAMGECVRHLAARGLVEPLQRALETRPFLGICLGLQSLFDWSAENGGTAGLGFYQGRVERFPEPLLHPQSGERLKVPHMGWNTLVTRAPHPLFNGIGPEERFYFVHSYFVNPARPELVLAEAEHGVRFCAAAGGGNVFATQFHPEKSQRAGLALLANFLAWDGSV